MLGEPLSMLVPQVVGFRLSGELPEGATATDLVLTVTELLRKTGVVGKFVEYFGEGLASLPVADRATIGEHVARVRRDVRLLPRRRPDARVPAAHRPQRRAHRARRGVLQGEPALARPVGRAPTYSQVVELDLSSVEPSLAGPRRPQDRVPLARAKESFIEALGTFGVEYANGELRQGGRRHVPASDPTTEQAPATSESRIRRRAVAVAEPKPRTRPRRRSDYELDRRQRRDRGDHVVHEHVEPAGDGRRRAAGEERRRARAEAQAVGEVVARAGLEGRHRVLREGRARPLPRRARLQHRRLRLHDVHRQLGAAAGGDLGGRRPRATSSSAPSSPATATSRRASIPR